MALGTDDRHRKFAGMNLANRLRPRRPLQEFDAEAAARAPWFQSGPADDNGAERVYAIACHAVKFGLEDEDIINILRQYVASRYLTCHYSDDRLMTFVFEADPSWWNHEVPLSDRTRYYNTLYSDIDG